MLVLFAEAYVEENQEKIRGRLIPEKPDFGFSVISTVET